MESIQPMRSMQCVAIGHMSTHMWSIAGRSPIPLMILQRAPSLVALIAAGSPMLC